MEGFSGNNGKAQVPIRLFGVMINQNENPQVIPPVNADQNTQAIAQARTNEGETGAQERNKEVGETRAVIGESSAQITRGTDPNSELNSNGAGTNSETVIAGNSEPIKKQENVSAAVEKEIEDHSTVEDAGGENAVINVDPNTNVVAINNAGRGKEDVPIENQNFLDLLTRSSSDEGGEEAGVCISSQAVDQNANMNSGNVNSNPIGNAIPNNNFGFNNVGGGFIPQVIENAIPSNNFGGFNNVGDGFNPHVIQNAVPGNNFGGFNNVGNGFNPQVIENMIPNNNFEGFNNVGDGLNPQVQLYASVISGYNSNFAAFNAGPLIAGNHVGAVGINNGGPFANALGQGYDESDSDDSLDVLVAMDDGGERRVRTTRDYYRMIGRCVSKVFRGRRYLGWVAAYYPQTQMFTVLYEDARIEDMDVQTLENYLPTFSEMHSYFTLRVEGIRRDEELRRNARRQAELDSAMRARRWREEQLRRRTVTLNARRRQ